MNALVHNLEIAISKYVTYDLDINRMDLQTVADDGKPTDFGGNEKKMLEAAKDAGGNTNEV